MNIKLDFKHNQTAHCETGATANLLNFNGMQTTEPLVFGIGGGLFFGYFPFVKLNYIPLTTFRHAPGKIFNSFTRRLGVKVERKYFKDQKQAMDELDAMLEQGKPVACQTGVYWLPYFPSAYRFHFNAHNIVVYGRQNGSYLVSDPNMEHPVTITYEDLQRARFAKGALAPKGKMYYPTDVPAQTDLVKPVRKGLKEIAFNMTRIPFPLVGVRGIRYVAKQVEKWPQTLGPKQAARYLGQVIRMQEEIGTGGAGFRFLFASFLQEAAEILSRPQLMQLSHDVTAVGDRWREFALLGARLIKGRTESEDVYPQLAGILRNCAEQEERIFTDLRKIQL